MIRPGCSRAEVSIFVNGHGPAMHEARALRNSLPTPASSEIVPIVAFHFLSGAHSDAPLQGTLPSFVTSNARTALPTFSSAARLIEYLTTGWATICLGRLSSLTACRAMGTISATVILLEIGTYRFRGS